MAIQKTLSFYGMPSPSSMSTELERERLSLDSNRELQLLQHLHTSEPNNPKQEQFYDEFVDLFNNFTSDWNDATGNIFIFLNGPGGVGKSSLMKKMIAFVRSEGNLTKVCATTTLASLLFPSATTAHNLFHFPVVEEEDRDDDFPLQCRLDRTDRWECLMDVTVIFWDEFASSNKEMIESFVSFASRRHKYFIFFCTGDMAQIGPIVKYGLPHEVIAASVKSSHFWKHFRIWTLTDNMRIQGTETNANASAAEIANARRERLYAQSLLDMSRNYNTLNTTVLSEVDENTKMLKLPLVGYFTTNQRTEALRWLYEGI